MADITKAALRFIAILGLCLGAGLAAGAGLARAVAAQDLPTMALEDPAGAHLEDPAAEVFAWLAALHSLEADFVQQGPTGAIARGTLYLERPGKARFEYEPSVPILIVADGDMLRFIDYEIGQVTPLPVKETPLALLLEPVAALKERIEIVDQGPGPMPGGIALAVRDPKHPEYGTLTLFFDQLGDDGEKKAAALRLLGWQVLDGQGQTTHIMLGAQKTNIALSQKLFSFEDPRRGPVAKRPRAG